MKRDRSKQHSDDQPLANNEFFRRVETATADGATDADDAETLVETSPSAPEEVDPAELMAWANDDAEPADVAGSVDEPEDDDEPDSAVDTRAGRLATAVGGVVAAAGAALAGIGAATPETVGPMLTSLGTVGVTPFGICLAGLLVTGVGLVRRQAVHTAATQEDRLDRLARSLRQVTDSGNRSEPALGDEALDRMLVALQRQDEKINNLTRATKLYGKPLVDISNQVAELAGQQTDPAQLAQRVRSALTDPLAELEQRVDAATRAAQEARSAVTHVTDELTSATKRLTATIEELQLEVTELQQRAMTESRQGFASVATKLDEQRDATPAAPTNTLQLDELEQSLSSIQREVQSLATAHARKEWRPAPGASAPRSAPAVQPATPTPTAPTASGDTGGDDVPKIAGERRASGKNVLGAIAKLKSMRS